MLLWKALRSFTCSALLIASISSTSRASDLVAPTLTQQAEAARAAGRLGDAAALYAQARAAAPLDVTAARGACAVARAREAAGELGVASREPCRRAVVLGSYSAEDMRNEVDAIMSANLRPTMDDLAFAALALDVATHKSPEQPWGYLGRCDVARRLGSAAVLDSCLRDLERVAPNHPATRQAQASITRPASPGIWLLRALVSLFLLGTSAHALRRWRSPPRASRQLPGSGSRVAVGVVVLAFLASFLAFGGRAFAVAPKANLGPIEIDDANPEASIPSEEEQNKKPLDYGYYLQDLLTHAQLAKNRGDHATAARLYKALTLAAPQAAVSPRLWCEQLRAIGDTENAIIACRTAITRQGTTTGDYVQFVNLILASDKPLPAEEPKELDNVLSHLEKESTEPAVAATLRCKVALRFQDVPGLRACTEQLVKVAPNDPQTVSFQWALAVARHDASEATRLLDRAKSLGVGQDGLARMEKTTSELGRQRMGQLVLVAVSVAMLALAALAGRRWLAARRGAAA